jgi:hypothetical protein
VPKQDLPDDSFNHSLSAIPDLLARLDCPFEIDFQALSDRLADVPDEANGLLKLFDGRRTLREALAGVQDAAQAAAAAKDLSALGVIHPVTAAAGSTAKPAAAREASECAEAAASLAKRAGAPKVLAAVPLAPPRIVRFPARRKRLPPPPGRVGGDGSGDLAATSSSDGGGVGGGAPDGQRRRSRRLAREASECAEGAAAGAAAGATSGWHRHRLAGTILIAGALAAAVLSALVFMHRS